MEYKIFTHAEMPAVVKYLEVLPTMEKAESMHEGYSLARRRSEKRILITKNTSHIQDPTITIANKMIGGKPSTMISIDTLAEMHEISAVMRKRKVPFYSIEYDLQENYLNLVDSFKPA